MKNYLLIILGCLFFITLPVIAQGKDLNIVFIPKSNDQVFWDIMRSGVDEAIKEIKAQENITLTWRGPSYNDDTDAQIRILQTYSRPNIDAIIIAPTDRERLVAPIQKAADQGIKMIVVDSAVNGTAHQAAITTDNYASGQLAAKHLVNILNRQGRIVVFRIVAGSASTDDRAQGFIDYLQKNAPDMKIIADIYGGGSRGKALHSATELLKETPGIDGIFAVNESATDGVLRALRNASRAGQIKLVGFDTSDFLLDGLKTGEVDGLVIQNPRQMGYLSIKAAVAAINNPVTTTKTTFTEAKLITKENYQAPEIRKLMSAH
jgi:ribose transport system substrate-binding protein